MEEQVIAIAAKFLPPWLIIIIVGIAFTILVYVYGNRFVKSLKDDRETEGRYKKLYRQISTDHDDLMTRFENLSTRYGALYELYDAAQKKILALKVENTTMEKQIYNLECDLGIEKTANQIIEGNLQDE